jgi:uncharacterized protein (DUF2249 family)
VIVIDARGLEPPRPFELVMEALCELQPGDSIKLILDRVPYPLFRVLDRNGYRYQVAPGEPGSYEIDITPA